MWELDHKKGWALKNLCFQTVVLEKTLESPLKSEEIKPVNPKGNQTWIFIGRTDAEAEEPTFWPPDVKSQLMSKDPDCGKDWAKKRSGWQRKWGSSWRCQLDNSVFKPDVPPFLALSVHRSELGLELHSTARSQEM